MLSLTPTMTPTAAAATRDPALSRPLDRAVRSQLEHNWHTLSWRSRCSNHADCTLFTRLLHRIHPTGQHYSNPHVRRGGVCYDPVSATTQMQRCARRTAVRDLAAVQGLVSQLLSYDAVTFLSRLEGLRLSEAGSSIWLYHEAAHVLFEQASDMQV
jgi:hypothetical protein